MDLERLYTAPLDDFVSVRDELVAELKEKGQAENAARVKKLRKPPISAWAVNQLAHSHREEIAELLDLTERIEAARDAAQLREGSAARRDVINRLLKSAEDVLESAGHGTGGATMHRISNTLYAATTEENRARLAEGRLETDLQPEGAGAFGLGSMEVSEPDDAATEGARAAATQRAEDLERKAVAAERDAREATRAVEKLRISLERAEREAERALARADEVRAAADDARDDL